MATYPHVIRLREPWRRAPLAGGVRLRRSFNCPTALEPRERVWLVVEGISLPGTAACNGQQLGPLNPLGHAEFDITGCLAARNEVELCLLAAGHDAARAAPPPAPLELGPLESVSLEIRQLPQS